MDFRLAELQDIGNIFSLIQQAQIYFRSIGNPQWQNGYPNPAVIRQDIGNHSAYVLQQDGRIIAACTLIFTGEPTYGHIYLGQWLQSGPYAAIHRLAVAQEYKGRGIACQLLSHLEKECIRRDICDIRVDTHRKNLPMRRFLQKNGFSQCGIIYLADHSERLAYEKDLRAISV